MSKAAWNFEEKLAVATAMAMDKRLTPADCRVGLAMLLYFQNTSSGATFPSRPQICEATGLKRNKVIEATKRLREFGYLAYEKSDGGRNKRNSYAFLKTVSKRIRFKGANGIETDTPPVSKRIPAPVSKRIRAITPSNLTLRGEASPPTLKRVEASLKKEKGQQGEIDEKQEREANLAKLDEAAASLKAMGVKANPKPPPRMNGPTRYKATEADLRLFELQALGVDVDEAMANKPKPAPQTLEPALVKNQSIFMSVTVTVEPPGFPELPDFLRRTPEPEATR